MKKFTIILLLLPFFLSSKGQSYVPFPKDSARWGIEHRYSTGAGTGYNYYNYQVSGYTIIKNKKYSNAYGCGTKAIPVGLEPFAFIREDSKRVYIRYGQDTSEYLIYDFTLKEKDTFKMRLRAHFKDSIYSFIIKKIDSIKIGQQYRKRYELELAKPAINLCHFNYWIEGIGNTMDPLYSDNWVNCFERIYYVVCFYHKEERLYTGPFGNKCHLTVGMYEDTSDPQQSEIYPNPVYCVSTLKVPLAFSANTVEVFNLLGRRIITMPIKGEELSIHRQDFLPGYYIYRIRNARGKSLTGNFIVK